MSKIIQALEQIGNDAKLQNEQAIEQWLVTTELEADQAETIINKDIISLERQLDVCPDVVCIILPAEDDDDDDKKGDDDDENEPIEKTSYSVIGFY